ncbi:hypothetical protein K1719_046471 [Acacia pycnantha]|nr:hypothetical protein K1719_046471 [Acacia pycnantha]
MAVVDPVAEPHLPIVSDKFHFCTIQQNNVAYYRYGGWWSVWRMGTYSMNLKHDAASVPDVFLTSLDEFFYFILSIFTWPLLSDLRKIVFMGRLRLCANKLMQ